MNCAARQGESALKTPHAWRELTCQEYEDAIRADDEAHIASSITDPDGVYGSPLTFTLWLMSDGSYLSTALEGRRDTEDYKCSHAASVPVLETPSDFYGIPWKEAPFVLMARIATALGVVDGEYENLMVDGPEELETVARRVKAKAAGAPVEPVPATSKLRGAQ